MAEKASVFRCSGRNVEAHNWAEEITGTAKGRTKQGRKQRYKIKVDIKISGCSAGGSAPALGKKRERCQWQKKRAFLGEAVGMSRLTIEPKRLRKPQKGGQSRADNSRNK